MNPIYHDAILNIKDCIEQYINEKHGKNENIEIEFRIGFNNDDHFNTDIGKTFFNKIISKFNESNMFKKNEKYDDLFYKEKRLTIKNDKNSVCIKKTKLAVFDFAFKGTSFDIRVSISKETPVNKFQPEKAEYKRSKDRTSFEYKSWSYDFTIVSIVENTIETKLYEIELESINPDLSKCSSYYLCHDAFLKLTDIIKICDPIEDDPKVVLISKKNY